MSDFYEKNIAALNKYQPQFETAEKEPSLNLELVTLSGGILDIKCDIKGERGYIHGGASPLETAKSRTSEIELKGNGLIVSFGLGFGYEAREIISKMDKGTNFVIVEPCPEIFEAVLKNADITDIISSPNVHFYAYSGKQEAYPFFRKFINRTNYKNLAAFVLSPYFDLFFAVCRDLFFVIDDTRSTFEMSEATVKSFTAQWQKNALQNFKHAINSYIISDFFGKFEKIPAVIVSAGPSLSKNISELKDMEDKCLIISVDTALKPLFENGITPHFVVSVDAQEIVRRKFDGLDYSRIPLVYVPTSSAAVVDGHRGRKLLSVVQDIFLRDNLISLGKNTRYLEMGGSVATSAFSFAQHLGCGPIILIGQDLAFTGLKSHIEGAAFYKEVDPGAIPGALSVPSTDGGTVYTDRTFLSYITWFQTYASSDKSGREYIDATEGGAKLLGFECESLSEVKKKYMAKDGVLKLVERAFEEAPLLAAAEKKHLRDNFSRAASFIESLPSPAKTASKQLAVIYGLLSKKKPNQQAINAAYSKISAFESKIKSSPELLNIIGIALEPLSEKLNAEFENAKFNNEYEKNRFAALSYSKYYGEIAERSGEFIGLLKEESK